jgi:hypothetical protein
VEIAVARSYLAIRLQKPRNGKEEQFQAGIEPGTSHKGYGKVKVKFSLCLINYAPCHEAVWGVEVQLHHP